MKVVIQSSYNLRRVGKAIETGGLPIEINSKVLEIELSSENDVDIAIAYISRLLYTLTFHEFELNNEISPSLINLAKKDFSGTIYIRSKLLSFFRNNNLILDVDKFIKYNLSNIDDFYDYLLRGLSTDSILDKIQNYFVSNNPEIKQSKLKLNFISCVDKNCFFFQIVDENHNHVLGSYNDSNSHLAMSTIRSYKNKKIKIAGAYTMDVINMLYEKCIEYGCQNLEFIFQ